MDEQVKHRFEDGKESSTNPIQAEIMDRVHDRSSKVTTTGHFPLARPRYYGIESSEYPLPWLFRKYQKGAESVDVRGYKLPEQVFKGVCFYLLDGEKSDKLFIVGLANSLEWIIKTYGGKVLVDRDYIDSETIVIGSYDQLLNQEYLEKTRGVIYKPDMVYFHADKEMRLSTHSKENFKIVAVSMPKQRPDVGDVKMEGVVDSATKDIDAELSLRKEMLQGKETDNAHDKTIPGGIGQTDDTKTDQSSLQDEISGTRPSLKKMKFNESFVQNQPSTNDDKHIPMVDTEKNAISLKKKRNVFATMFRLAKSYKNQSKYIKRVIAKCKTDYGDDVSEEKVKDYLRRRRVKDDVTDTYDCLKDEYNLTENDLKRMIKIVKMVGDDIMEKEKNAEK